MEFEPHTKQSLRMLSTRARLDDLTGDHHDTEYLEVALA